MKPGIALLCAGMFLTVISCQKRIDVQTPKSDAQITSDAVVLSELSVTAVSSPATGLNAVGHLIDGSLATAWTGDNNATVYLPDPNSQIVTFRLDTTSMKTVAYIRMAFNTGGSTTIQYNFDVLVSQDGQTGWVNVLNNAHSAIKNTGLQTFDFPDVKGRWVRIVGHGNNGTSPKSNSWTEVQIFGAVAPVTNSVKITVTPGHVTANNFVAPYVPANVVDGNISTYWTSKMTGTADYKNVTLNLGANHLIDQVRISFYTGGDPKRVSRFGIFVSKDSITWAKVVSNTWSASTQYGQRLESFDFPDVNAKFVRVECYGHTGTYSAATINSVNEIEVDGSPIANNICKISSIRQASNEVLANQRRGDFTYNAQGKLTQVTFYNKDLGRYEYVLWQYTYNSSNQLTHLNEYPSTNSGPYGAVPYTIIDYFWKNGRIVKTQLNHVDVGAESVTYDSVVYDTKGRVIADYNLTISGDPPYSHYESSDTARYQYDSHDNRIFTGTSYDTKTSFLQTDSVLMFQYRNYSKNNPQPVAGYNNHGLPTGFPEDLTYHLPFYFFDARVIPEIDYTCTE